MMDATHRSTSLCVIAVRRVASVGAGRGKGACMVAAPLFCARSHPKQATPSRRPATLDGVFVPPKLWRAADSARPCVSLCAAGQTNRVGIGNERLLWRPMLDV